MTLTKKHNFISASKRVGYVGDFRGVDAIFNEVMDTSGF